jgi:hypothetical protein
MNQGMMGVTPYAPLWCGGLFGGDVNGGSIGRGDGDGVHGVAAFAPGVEPALQRANVADAFLSEEQRHTGASGFVWSSTVENDFAVAR